jgi:HD-GYP domain-containing protein (c-di-GMP phosphodiesterase class II)
MGLSEQELICIGTAALIHDIGLLEMPLVTKSIKRNQQEELLWREHPKYGYYILKELGFPDEIIDIVQYHHENWDGSGYPKGLSGKQIPIGARILSVCETYSRLKLHENYTNHQAIEYIYGAGNYFFDLEVVKCFTDNLSVYPLGSLVRLTSGEVGVVANVRKNKGPRPVIRVYYNKVNRPLTIPKVVDLGQQRTVFIEKVF